ncbi:MAG: response regulator [Vicinamibacteria bacterium]|nr:response regulator [Vicinamibacteria bacterium]
MAENAGDPLSAEDSAARRVLVVDDEPDMLGVVAEVLTEAGLEVRTETDPVAAVKAATETEYGAAVVDLVMPGLSGLDVATRIQEVHPLTQVVVLTGHEGIESAVQALQRGVFDYIRKGEFDAHHLGKVVRGSLERRALLRSNQELLDRVLESNELLRVLVERGTGIARAEHVDRLLELLVDAARRLTGAELVRVLLLRPGREVLIEEAAGDAIQGLAGVRLAPGEGLAPLAAESDEGVSVEAAEAHPRYSRRCDAMPTARPGWMAVPLHHGSVHGVLVVAGRKGGFHAQHQLLLRGLARQAGVALDRTRALEQADNFFTHVSQLLVAILDRIDAGGRGHSRRVAALSDMVSRRLGMSEDERRDLHFGALLHDIGKIQIAPEVLTAPPTEEQQRVMREHPRLGLELLRPITRFERLLSTVHAHHERWDGGGYPLGLAGEEIPRSARVVAVANAFDVLTHEVAPGAMPLTEDQALEQVQAGTGTAFDPLIVRLFVAEYRLHRHLLVD